MENMNKFITWLKTLPIYLRIVVLVAISALVLVVSMSLSACGLTRVNVRNGADGTTTTVSLTTNNPTSVEASPNVTLTVQKPSKDVE